MKNKNKFSLCFRPVAVEAEETVVSHDHHVSYDSVSTNIVPGGNPGTVSSTTGKSPSRSGGKTPKLIRRRGVAFKHFPSLFKAVIFPDPMKNIHQLELHMKSNGPVKNRKRFHVLHRLDSETGKPEITAENQPEEKPSIDLPKTMPPKTSCSSWMSCFHTIVLALLATIFLGRIRAIILITLGLGSIHWWRTRYFRPPLDMMKSETAAPGENHDETGKS